MHNDVPTKPATAPTIFATVLIVLEKLGETSRKAQDRPEVTKPKKPRATFMKMKAAVGVFMKPEMMRDPPESNDGTCVDVKAQKGSA